MVPGHPVEKLPIVRNTIYRVVETFAGFLYVVPNSPPIPEHEGPFEVVGVIKHHHTSTSTRGDDMTRVETGGAYIRAISLNDGIGGIFKEDDVREGFPDGFPIWNVTDEIGEKKALRV